MSLGEIKTIYHNCVTLKRRMERINTNGMSDAAQKIGHDNYYKIEEELQSELRDLLRTNFLLLSKPELVRFLSLCSSHRPEPPHSVLTRIGMLYKESYP